MVFGWQNKGILTASTTYKPETSAYMTYMCLSFLGRSNCLLEFGALLHLLPGFDGFAGFCRLQGAFGDAS